MVQGLVWFKDGSRTVEWGVYRRLSIPLGKQATVFQAEVYAILACVHETNSGSAREIRICSDNQAALKALQAAKTSPLV